MSSIIKRCNAQRKDVLAWLGRTEICWRGQSLSRRDHNTFVRVLLMEALVMTDLSKRYEGFGSEADHVLWAANAASVDVADLAAFLSDGVDLLRRLSFPEEAHLFAESFKHSLREKYSFTDMLLLPMLGALDLHSEHLSPETFRPLYQVFSFLTHTTLVDLDQSEELEQSYLSTEHEVAAHVLPAWFVEQMNQVMRAWFRGFNITADNFQPQHGPGSVAEVSGEATQVDKYQGLAPDAIIEYVFRHFAGLDPWSYVPLRSGVPTSRESRTVFVPKSMKTRRVISMEPCTLMYFEKGVEYAIKQFVAEHEYLSRRIDFNDQSKQAARVVQASRTGKLATVDLSAASDRVSFDLVKRVFRGTALYPFLVALRSRTTVLPSGREVRLAKFAPMGSALCFPIQTLIFACVAECTARYVDATAVVDGSPSTSRPLYEYSVYGDDIIVDDRLLSDLIVHLEWCGFAVNYSKTYGGRHLFRESCGCDAFDGVEVSPLRVSRKYSARGVTSVSPDVFGGLIDFVNSAKLYDLPTLRMFLLDNLLSETSYVPLFSEDARRGVWTDDATNYRLPWRWNDAYHRFELRAAVVHPTCSLQSSLSWDDTRRRYVEEPEQANAEFIRYFAWLRAGAFRKPPCGVSDPEFGMPVHIGSVRTSLINTWVGDPHQWCTTAT